jgi:hypothetical protein
MKMSFKLDKEGELKIKLGDAVIRLKYKRPTPAEIIEALVKKMPRGKEDEDALNILSANLELGISCLSGIGDDDFELAGRLLNSNPLNENFRDNWKELLADACPLLLIALGQFLSSAPSFIDGKKLKKV